MYIHMYMYITTLLDIEIILVLDNSHRNSALKCRNTTSHNVMFFIKISQMSVLSYATNMRTNFRCC